VRGGCGLLAAAAPASRAFAALATLRSSQPADATFALAAATLALAAAARPLATAAFALAAAAFATRAARAAARRNL